MQNDSSSSGPAALILIDIREDAIYARIGGLQAANPALAAITASQVSESDIRAAAVRVGTSECIARFEEKLEIQIATAAIRAAEKRLRGTDMARPIFHVLQSKARFRRWRAGQYLKRWWWAWHYARERLTADEAQDIIMECRSVAGWYPLLTLSVQDTLEAALDEYQDHPRLRDYVADACAQVSRKWEANSDERWAAQDWAIRLVAEYAADDGGVLTSITAPPEGAAAARA